MLDQIETQWKIRVSKDTLKRMLKGLAMSWRRMRRVGQAPDDPELAKTTAVGATPTTGHQIGEIDLRYLDESVVLFDPVGNPYA